MAPVVPVMPVVVPPRAMADPPRSVIGPDHPAAVRITVINGIVTDAVEAPMEVVPVVEVRPVVGMAIAAIMKRAVAAAMEHRRGTETAAVEATAVEAATVKTSMTAAAMTTMAAANLDHRAVGCDFRRRRGAGARKRQRFCTLLCADGEHEDRRSR